MTISLHGGRVLVCGLILAGAFGGAVTCGAAPDGWQSVAPADAGFHVDVAKQLDEAVRKGELRNLHAVVIARDGKLAFERYYEGSDERWTVPLGTVRFGPDVKHDLRSTSKAIVGLLYGIALREGKVPAPDQPLLQEFPAYRDLAGDPRRRRIKVAHVLSMTLGTEWHEDLPYTDPRNSEVAMYRAPDAARFVLEHPMAAEPGSRWQYNGGATAVLGQLIAQGTGMPLFDYARKKLFQPLGIVDAEWVKGPNGVAAAASGVRLRPRDLAKIGQLMLDGGRWGGEQVVPAEWFVEALKPHGHPPPMSDAGEFGYGYHWGLVRLKGSDQLWIFAPGNGGQRLIIVPDLKLVAAILAGNYNAPDQDVVPDTVMMKFVMPALAEPHTARASEPRQ